MREKEQLKKLKKILGFYEQNLELLRSRFVEQSSIVAKRQKETNRLTEYLAETQEKSAQAEASVFSQQMAVQVLDAIEMKIVAAQEQLNDSKRILEERRVELYQQMSKTESLEKLVAKKQEAIVQQHRQSEQRNADERFLNTYFTG